MKNKKYDWKYLSLTIGLLFLTFFSFVFRKELMVFIKLFFEYKYLNIIAGSVSSIIVIVNKIKNKKITFKVKMSYNEFRVPMEDIISFIGNPITIVGSLTLAKGIYFQTVLGRKFFTELDGVVDLSFIGLVTAYLIYNSTMELYLYLIEISTTKTYTQEENPTPQFGINDEAPDINIK